MIESERAFVVPCLEQNREHRSLRRCDEAWCAADRIEHIVVRMKEMIEVKTDRSGTLRTRFPRDRGTGIRLRDRTPS